MTEQKKEVSYFAYEGMIASLERCNKRMLIIAVILFIALIASNALWFFVKF